MSSSPSASRSKAMNDAGVFVARNRTRLSAGCRRSCSASKSNPAEVATTISPSITHRSGNATLAASTSSGKYRVSGRSLRLPYSTLSPSRKQMDRKPSHFGSYEAPGGMTVTDLASIGRTGGRIGKVIGGIVAGPGSDPADPLQPLDGVGHRLIRITLRHTEFPQTGLVIGQ